MSIARTHEDSILIIATLSEARCFFIASSMRAMCDFGGGFDEMNTLP